MGLIPRYDLKVVGESYINIRISYFMDPGILQEPEILK